MSLPQPHRLLRGSGRSFGGLREGFGEMADTRLSPWLQSGEADVICRVRTHRIERCERATDLSATYLRIEERKLEAK